MAWFEDLSLCDYFSWDDPMPVAIGWLESGADFPQGKIDARIQARLSELLVEPWQPFVFRGYHICSLCDGPDPVRMPNHGWLNLFVPQGERLFVAPSSIKHYIQAHHYAPPQAFVDAVMACPQMGSEAYFAALKRTPAGQALIARASR